MASLLLVLVWRLVAQLLGWQRTRHWMILLMEGLNSRLTTKHGGVAVGVVLGAVGRAIALKAMAASWECTVVRVGVVRDGLVGRCFVLLLQEERRLLEEHQQGLDSRLTAKQGVFAVLGGGRAIA
uniref:Secreted protein n=1 Tax=Pseudo-nitzschia australis TaxID=44445 RepID=A0A7S4AR36_9STRA